MHPVSAKYNSAPDHCEEVPKAEVVEFEGVLHAPGQALAQRSDAVEDLRDL